MNISEYLTKINQQSQLIFKEILKDTESLGNAHHRASCIFDFSEALLDKNEASLLKTASAQIEASILSLSLGLYRQAYSSMRLAFELGLGTVHFSINKMEHFEWLAGSTDIIWSKLIDSDNGILSTRFCKAFYPELKDEISTYNSRAIVVYRSLSEYVHGNYETWSESGIQLKRNKELEKTFFSLLQDATEIILFVLIVRYIKTFEPITLEEMEFISEEMGHIEAIRTYFGGPKS